MLIYSQSLLKNNNNHIKINYKVRTFVKTCNNNKKNGILQLAIISFMVRNLVVFRITNGISLFKLKAESELLHIFIYIIITKKGFIAL